MQRRCEECDGRLKYTGHILYRHTGSMTLTQALKENIGDPERRTYCRHLTRASKKKEEDEVSQKGETISFQEVGLDHSSDEVW